MVATDLSKRGEMVHGRLCRAAGGAALLLCLLFQTTSGAGAGSPSTSVRIISPSSGAVVTGPVRIVVEPTDENIEWVNVSTDGEYLASSPPYTFTWDSTQFAGGSHVITVTAYDSNNVLIGSASSQVKVSNPAVSIILPSTAAIVAGTMNVFTKVTQEVDWINLSVDGQYVSSPDYNFNLDTGSFADGLHTITIDALQDPDTLLGSASIVVDFANEKLAPALIAGGYRSTSILDATETFDPASRIFSASGNMPLPRSDHTATRLLNGQVLFAGGIINSQDDVTATAELYDAASGVFTATGSMSDARVYHTATLLADGRVLVAGGIDAARNVTATAEVYDATLGKFSPTGDMNTPRTAQAALLLPNHLVLLTGGIDNGYATLSGAELYDPAQNIFIGDGDMLSPRTGHSMTLLATGDVLITGGAGKLAELFDPGLNTFSPTGPMTVARQSATATLLTDGKVLITGGISDGNVATASAELYDPLTGTFAPTGSMAAARAGHTATLLTDGTVLIVGGGTDVEEIYDPGSGSFVSVGELISPLSGGQSVTLIH